MINPRPRKQIRRSRRGLGRAGGDEPLAPLLQAPHPGPWGPAPGGALSSDDDSDAPDGDTRGEGCDQPAARAAQPDTPPLRPRLGTRTDLDATPPVRPHRQPVSVGVPTRRHTKLMTSWLWTPRWPTIASVSEVGPRPPLWRPKGRGWR